jgi:hypothetical protein
MKAPDPEDFTMLQKVIAAGAAVVAPVWVARSWIEKRFSKKMDKEDFAAFMGSFNQHIRDDREVQAKLFDKVDDIKTLIIDRLPIK